MCDEDLRSLANPSENHVNETHPTSVSSNHSENGVNETHPTCLSPSTTPLSCKLRKIPPIIVQRTNPKPEGDESAIDAKNVEQKSNIILASSLGLNHIRTRSTLSSSPLSFPSKRELGGKDERSTTNLGTTCSLAEQGKKAASSPSRKTAFPVVANKSSQCVFSKEMESPRFQAIMRMTSGKKKKTPNLKSLSCEFNSKGVQHFPVRKPRAFGHAEEVLVTIREKFDKAKEEVNSELTNFVADLVNYLDEVSEFHMDFQGKESFEDLFAIARDCSKMSSADFLVNCEEIVQKLYDKRQDLPCGIHKQAHTRLLFILTRCSRLLPLQKENEYGLHQSDLGIYTQKALEVSQQDFSGPWVFENTVKEELTIIKEEDPMDVRQDQLDPQDEVATTKSVDSTSGNFRMSSWKKLPSSAKKKKDLHVTDSVPKLESSQKQSENLKYGGKDNCEIEIPAFPHSSGIRKSTWGVWSEQQTNMYDNLMICRICDVEIPVVHVWEHSLICTIVDRCDLKWLSVNDRLQRAVQTLEKIIELWTPENSSSSPRDGSEVEASSIIDRQFAELPTRNNFFNSTNDDLFNSCDLTENLKAVIGVPVVTKSSAMHATEGAVSSTESLTPRSTLLSPCTTQIELLLSGRGSVTEYENCQQISKLHSVAISAMNINGSDTSELESLRKLLENLKYVTQDRKVDALIVDTFGRRLEKLLQEKYMTLCDDDKDNTGDDESSEDDPVRSLRASPINGNAHDRTSIEDFEIIKPISRGAFGRVFLARKRKTGDIFAIKVLRKSDMIRKNAVENILAERNILISAQNPLLVRFYYSFTCSDNLYLVMEYLNGGDLYSLLQNLGCLDEDMARMYIAEIVLALEYLHSLNVIHRDLKPDNLLISQDGHIKLTDFGLSKVGLIDSTDDLSGPLRPNFGILNDGKPTCHTPSKIESKKRHSAVGTPDYLSPEILLGRGHGATADWWSVGVILFELLVGVPPFNAETPQQIFDNIINRDIPWPKSPSEMSYNARDLIDKLLTENPVQRLGARGAEEVKMHPFFKDIKWDTLGKEKAAFIPSAEAYDTSYFMTRYMWNPEDENARGGSDVDEISSTTSIILDEERDEFNTMADLVKSPDPMLDTKYSFSNFSFKNLSQLATINYDLVVKSSKPDANA